MQNDQAEENNVTYSSILKVAFSDNPKKQAEYHIGPFKTPRILQYHCKLLLTNLYQSYPQSTALLAMIQEINEQQSSEDTNEYDISQQNVLYLLPWISLITGQQIKKIALQKQHTNIIAKITNNHELVFFIRQEIDPQNRLEIGLICPTNSKFCAMYGFLDSLRIMGMYFNPTNLVIAEPNIGMVYIDELLCPKTSSMEATHTNNSIYRVPVPNTTQPLQTSYAVESDQADPPLESRPISPLIFRSMNSHNEAASEIRRAPTSTLRL